MLRMIEAICYCLVFIRNFYFFPLYFNISNSDWGSKHLRDDGRWKYSTPPTGSAIYTWVQHMIHHLSPSGVIGLVLANASMSSNTRGEGDTRKNIVEADLIDCMVALP